MMGHNNPMNIDNFSDKMEFQGRGAGHIHGSAWCNLSKIAKDLDIECELTDSEDDYESDSEDGFEADRNPTDESNLEKAFKKLRKGEKLKRMEDKALIAFADKFTTCTLNPDMAAKMIDETMDISEGIKVVGIAEETQTHHHTRTCKKNGPDCRFGIPRCPIWKTILSRPVKGKTAEEKTERRKEHKEILEAVHEVLENEEAMETIMKEFGNKKLESKEEYIINRKKRILKTLEMAKVSKKAYL